MPTENRFEPPGQDQNPRGRVTTVRPITPDGDEILRGEIEVEFSDPRAVARILLALSPVPLPQEGEYRVILETAGHLIIERRLIALVKE